MPTTSTGSLVPSSHRASNGVMATPAAVESAVSTMLRGAWGAWPLLSPCMLMGDALGSRHAQRAVEELHAMLCGLLMAHLLGMGQKSGIV